MTDERARPEPGVGSVAEEAAKLVGALQDWARDSAPGPAAGGSGFLTSGLAAKLSEVNAHLATGGQDCAYCPLCQAISLVRAASPEVRAHLATAASALLQAAAGMVEPGSPPGREPGVERIDLD